MIEVILDVIHDTWLMLPLLYLAYFLLEVVERKDAYHAQERLLSLKKYGPLFGALIGLIPQCGFSVLAAGFYVDGAISLGTLIAVFISTSDEAIPILFAHPDYVSLLPVILGIKWLVAIVAGYAIDLFAHSHVTPSHRRPYQLHSCFCDHHERAVWVDALIRTIKIFGFVFAINLILSLVLYQIGDGYLSSILLERSIVQPFLAALVGFLPNCAASVILAQLYVSGILSFGALIAGLITSAGLGLMLLIRIDQDKKEVFKIFLLLLAIAWSCGTLLQLCVSL